MVQMVSRFPEHTGDYATLTTRFASQRSVEKGPGNVTHLTRRVIAVEHTTAPVSTHASPDLKKHYGPAICFERLGVDYNAPRQTPAAEQPVLGTYGLGLYKD